MALPYRPVERRTLENLLGNLGGMNPEFAYGVFQDTQQSALDRLLQQRGMRQERQATNQAAMTGLGDTLTQAALGGVPPEGLASLLGLQATANPALQRPNVSGQLGSLLGFAGGLSSSLPTPEGEALTITPEEFQVMDEDIRNWATGQVEQPSGLPMGLHEATMAIVSSLRVQGYPEEVLERVRAFIEQKWAQYGGPVRPGPAQGAAATPAPSAAAAAPSVTAGQTYSRILGYPDELR